MSDRELIKHKVRKLRIKRRWQVIFDYFLRGLIWGAVPAALIVFAAKLWIIPINTYLLAGGAFGVVILGFLVASIFVRITPLTVANEIDVALGLRERVSSALALSGQQRKRDPFIRAVVKDAARAIKKLPLRRVYPWSLPRSWQLALPGLLIVAALTFLPQLNWFISESDRAEAKLVQQEGHKLKELAEAIKQEAEKRQDPILEQQAEEIQRVGEKLSQGQIKKKEALKELQRLKEKLEAQAQIEVPEGERQLTAELAKQLMQLDSTRELGEMLEEGNLQALTEQLAELLKNLSAGKLSPGQEAMLDDLLKALEEGLKSEAADDPGAQGLKQQLEELKQALQQNQQLKQQLQDTMQSFEQDLNNLTNKLQQNNMAPQAQQLTQLMQQMNQQMSSSAMVDPQTLSQMHQSLQNTQQAIQNNQSLSSQQQQQLNQAAEQALSYFEQQESG